MTVTWLGWWRASVCQNSGGLKVRWDHVVKCTLNRNNLEMRKLTHYLLRKAQRSTKEIKVGSVSEAIGHTPVESRVVWYNDPRHLHAQKRSNHRHCPGLKLIPHTVCNICGLTEYKSTDYRETGRSARTLLDSEVQSQLNCLSPSLTCTDTPPTQLRWFKNLANQN